MNVGSDSFLLVLYFAGARWTLKSFFNMIKSKADELTQKHECGL